MKRTLVTFCFLFVLISCSEKTEYQIPIFEITDKEVLVNGEFIVSVEELKKADSNNKFNITFLKISDALKDTKLDNLQRVSHLMENKVKKLRLYLKKLSQPFHISCNIEIFNIRITS